MLEDYVKQLRKTLRIYRIVLLSLTILLVAVCALAISSFEITIDEDTRVDYDVEQTTDNSGDNTNTLNVNMDNQTYIVCGTIMVCVGIITTGLVAYGKSKNTHNYTQASSNNDSEKGTF